MTRKYTLAGASVHKMTLACQLIYYIDKQTRGNGNHTPLGNQFPCQLQGFAGLPQQENSLSPPPPKIPADASGSGRRLARRHRLLFGVALLATGLPAA